MQKKIDMYIWVTARSRTKEYGTSLPGPWIEKNTMFSECSGAHFSDYVIFMHSTGCAVQN